MTDTASPLERIAAALERIAPPLPAPADLNAAFAHIWRPDLGFMPACVGEALPLDLILGADAHRAALVDNTRRFAEGLPANNALLWGARGTGKSALVKAAVGAVGREAASLRIVEVGVEHLASLPVALQALAPAPWRVILFIDDLSFDGDEKALRALKPALAGGLMAQGQSLLVYATSNRRHLLARDPRENAADDLHWRDTAEERLALADRFGLSLGFHPLDQSTYLAIVAAYAERLDLAGADLERAALEWAAARGARSGRTAYQFMLDRAGRAGRSITFA